ncbi:MAG: glycosyltransferase, partial [Candidatus Thermoplasmatota archaeon]|nr:glycosyltransferase [Candidatus Thermoplasmatota archaeon]
MPWCTQSFNFTIHLVIERSALVGIGAGAQPVYGDRWCWSIMVEFVEGNRAESDNKGRLLYLHGDQGRKRPYPGISLIIPAFNEEDRISRALDSYIPVLKATGFPFEILVIMDGNDRTPEIVERYSHLGVTGFTYGSKLGKGGAVAKGVLLSSHDIVGYVDADGSLDAGDLAMMLNYALTYDCVVASRWLRESRWLRKEPLFNRIASRSFNIIVRGFLGIPVRDTQCGAKFFRSAIVKEVVTRAIVTNRTFDVDFLYHARRMGARMIEIPVRWSHDEDTRMPIFRVRSE